VLVVNEEPQHEQEPTSPVGSGSAKEVIPRDEGASDDSPGFYRNDSVLKKPTVEVPIEPIKSNIARLKREC
jgi:hypothetical protein